MLSPKTIDKIEDKLSVPVVIRELMESDSRDLPDAMQYGLHEVISDFQPDSALLCIALSVRVILEAQGYFSTALKTLLLECDRIIEDYAPLWLEHAREETIDQTLLFETLAAVPEDLEALAEMIALNVDLLHETNPKAAALCEILNIQATAHAIIAEHYVDVMDLQKEDENGDGDEEEGDILPFGALPPVVFSDNVIPFPGLETRG